jgi:hypothetical protein
MTEMYAPLAQGFKGNEGKILVKGGSPDNACEAVFDSSHRFSSTFLIIPGLFTTRPPALEMSSQPATDAVGGQSSNVTSGSSPTKPPPSAYDEQPLDDIA